MIQIVVDVEPKTHRYIELISFLNSGTYIFSRVEWNEKHLKRKNQELNWINIKDQLPPEHDLVLTLDATGRLSLSRYISNDFPKETVLWAEIELPK